MKTAIPSWYQRGSGDARRRQVEVEDRLRVLRHRRHLAAEEPPKGAIATGGLVLRHDVHQLVVHDRVDPLVGRRSSRRRSSAARSGSDRVLRGTVPAPALPRSEKSLSSDADLLRRLVVEQLALEAPSSSRSSAPRAARGRSGWGRSRPAECSRSPERSAAQALARRSQPKLQGPDRPRHGRGSLAAPRRLKAKARGQCRTAPWRSTTGVVPLSSDPRPSSGTVAPDAAPGSSGSGGSSDSAAPDQRDCCSATGGSCHSPTPR